MEPPEKHKIFASGGGVFPQGQGSVVENVRDSGMKATCEAFSQAEQGRSCLQHMRGP